MRPSPKLIALAALTIAAVVAVIVPSRAEPSRPITLMTTLEEWRYPEARQLGSSAPA